MGHGIDSRMYCIPLDIMQTAGYKQLVGGNALQNTHDIFL